MNNKEIIQIAKKHLKENPLLHNDYEWILPTEYIELKNEIYFDYSIQHKKNLPPEQWKMFAGAPGFCIHKITGEVREIGWQEFQDSII